MQYCALDVKATHEVFTEQLPLFMERSANPNPQLLYSHLYFLCTNVHNTALYNCVVSAVFL